MNSDCIFKHSVKRLIMFITSQFLDSDKVDFPSFTEKHGSAIDRKTVAFILLCSITGNVSLQKNFDR